VRNANTVDLNVFINNGNGMFEDKWGSSQLTNEGSDGRAVLLADFNGDDHLDIFTVAPLGYNKLYLGDGSGKFEDHSTEAGVSSKGTAQGCGAFDYDADGDLDIVVTTIAPSALTLYKNDGNGVFTSVEDELGVNYHMFGQGAVFADFNNDAHLMRILPIGACSFGHTRIIT